MYKNGHRGGHDGNPGLSDAIRFIASWRSPLVKFGPWHKPWTTHRRGNHHERPRRCSCTFQSQSDPAPSVWLCFTPPTENLLQHRGVFSHPASSSKSVGLHAPGQARVEFRKRRRPDASGKKTILRFTSSSYFSSALIRQGPAWVALLPISHFCSGRRTAPSLGSSSTPTSLCRNRTRTTKTSCTLPFRFRLLAISFRLGVKILRPVSLPRGAPLWARFQTATSPSRA